MIHQDTVRLMRQCGSGIKMGLQAIDQVYGSVSSQGFRLALDSCRRSHEALEAELRMLFNEYGQEEPEPSLLAGAMSRAKISASLTLSGSDSRIADMITDGSNMGIKNLRRYLNKYPAADERSRDITRRLCRAEEHLVESLGPYL